MRYSVRWSRCPATPCRRAPWKRSSCHPRVANYSPAMLDELTSTGEVYWVGDGAIGDADGWVRWYLADQEPHPPQIEPAHYRSQELLAALAGGGAYFFDSLLPAGAGHSRSI